METDFARSIAARLPGRVFAPGGDAYEAATSPKNAIAVQRPAFVVVPETPDEVAAAVSAADGAGSFLVQATGHGAGRSIDGTFALLDTSRLRAIAVDPERQTVRCGPGATFGEINAAAFEHGLLAPGGTAPDVAAAGYVAFGGIGWLTRPHGLASSALLSTDFVDGHGRSRRADDDDDRFEALWAYRGGGGVGVATSLELRLYPAEDLWAGYALWPLSDASDVVRGWGASLAAIDPALTSSIGFLHAPDAPTVPPELRGKRVVHLAAATVRGRSAAHAFEAFLASAPAPAIRTFGACDAARLSSIHLDPPAAVPAWGDGRWLTAEAASHVLEILSAAGMDDDVPLGEVELRHVASPVSDVAGAMTSCPGAFLLHAVGQGAEPAMRARTQRALDAVLAAAAVYDSGFEAAAFRDGRDAARDALPPATRARLKRIHEASDPAGTIVRSRVLY